MNDPEIEKIIKQAALFLLILVFVVGSMMADVARIWLRFFQQF